MSLLDAIDYEENTLSKLRQEVRELRSLVALLLMSSPNHVIYVSDLKKFSGKHLDGIVGATRHEADLTTAYWWDEGEKRNG